MLPLPDGTVSQPDRQQVALHYSGISAGAVVVTPIPTFIGFLCNVGSLMNR